MTAASERIILGIDPGTNVMGYGVIHYHNKQLSLIALGVVKLSQFDDHFMKLRHIFERTLSLIEQYNPDEMALEAPFFGKNVQSMLKLGRAQGVAMSAGLSRQIPIQEYSPKKVKQSITGNGNATKEQVAHMLQTLLKFRELPQYLDATDGLAVAVCHYFQNQTATSVSTKKHTGWKAFLADNPHLKTS